MQVVTMCREHFDFVLPSVQLDRRRRSFVGSPVTTDLIKFVFAWCFRCCKLLPWFGELKFVNVQHINQYIVAMNERHKQVLGISADN